MYAGDLAYNIGLKRLAMRLFFKASVECENVYPKVHKESLLYSLRILGIDIQSKKKNQIEM